MGNASSIDMMRRCVGLEVAQPIVKSLAGATQHVFEVSTHDFGRHGRERERLLLEAIIVVGIPF